MDNKYDELLQRLHFVSQGIGLQLLESRGEYLRGLLFARSKIRGLITIASVNSANFSNIRYNRLIDSIRELTEELDQEALKKFRNYTQALMDVSGDLKTVLRETK